jgi:tetratricopeptide (TPR) repeat protein
MSAKALFATTALAVAAAVALFVGCASSKTVVQPTQTPEEARRDTAKQYYSIGAGYLQQGETDAAIQNFKRSLTYDPAYYDVYLMMGTAYRRLNYQAQAEQVYNDAIKASPKQAKAYLELGDMLQGLGRDTTALQIYQEGLANDSSNADLYNGVAEVFLRRNQPKQADSVYKQAIARFPNELSVVWNWADFLFRQKRFADALPSLEPLAAQYPKIPEVRNKLADAYAGVKKYDKAAAQLETLLTLDPGNNGTIIRLGVAYQKAGKLKEAAQEYDTLIARDSTQPLPYRFKAEVLVAQGNSNSAEPLLRKAMRLDSHDLLAVADLGDVYLKRASDLNPKNLADATTPNLDEAIKLCDEAKGYYERASSDPDLRDYCASKTAYADKLLRSLKLERSVRD